MAAAPDVTEQKLLRGSFSKPKVVRNRRSPSATAAVRFSKFLRISLSCRWTRSPRRSFLPRFNWDSVHLLQLVTVLQASSELSLSDGFRREILSLLASHTPRTHQSISSCILPASPSSIPLWQWKVHYAVRRRSQSYNVKAACRLTIAPKYVGLKQWFPVITTDTSRGIWYLTVWLKYKKNFVNLHGQNQSSGSFIVNSTTRPDIESNWIPCLTCNRTPALVSLWRAVCSVHFAQGGMCVGDVCGGLLQKTISKCIIITA